MINLNDWLDRRAGEDERLYEQYGKALEQHHTGEFVAISADGQTILGTKQGEVLGKAIDAFGSGTFAFTRVGYRTLGRWLTL